MEKAIDLGLALLLGGFTTIFYWMIIWWLDRFEKEPWWLLMGAFLWGAVLTPVLSIVVELVAEGVIGVVIGGGAALDFTVTSGVAPITEEVFKGLGVLLIVLIFHREIDDPLDGMLYGATVGLGFAFTENALYYFGAATAGDISATLLFVLRGVVFGLNHAIFTGAFGLFLGLAKMNRNALVRLLLGTTGFVLAVGMHAGHNSLAGFMGGTGFVASWTMHTLTVIVSLIIAIIILFYERKWITKWLKPELANGYITPEIYKRATSWTGLTKEIHVLFTGGPVQYARIKRRRHLAAKLALRLRAYHKTKDPAYLRDVEKIRQQIRTLI